LHSAVCVKHLSQQLHRDWISSSLENICSMLGLGLKRSQCDLDPQSRTVFQCSNDLLLTASQMFIGYDSLSVMLLNF